MIRIRKIFLIIVLLVAAYFVYSAFYPSKDFYRQDFLEVSGVELPSSANFEFKSASYPDIHGDYTSVSIININTDFFNRLPSILMENGFSQNGNHIGHDQFDKVYSKLTDRRIEIEYFKEDMDKFHYVAFLSDKRSILVQRSSH